MSDPHQIDRRIAGAAGAPITNGQKRDIVLVAREAWNKTGQPFWDACQYAAGDPVALSQHEAFDLWRHDMQERATGHKHLTTATQQHYATLQELFHRLAGHEAAAQHWAAKAQFQPRRQARAKLDQEINRALKTGAIDRPRDYIVAIAARQFHTSTLEDLGEKQLWSLFYTLRKRVNKRLGLCRATSASKVSGKPEAA